MSDNFYFQGKFFETQEEFWKYVHQWPYMETNSDTIDRLMNALKKDIQMNIGLYNIKMTNGKINEIIQRAFLNMINEIMEMTK